VGHRVTRTQRLSHARTPHHPHARSEESPTKGGISRGISNSSSNTIHDWIVKYYFRIPNEKCDCSEIPPFAFRATLRTGVGVCLNYPGGNAQNGRMGDIVFWVVIPPGICGRSGCCFGRRSRSCWINKYQLLLCGVDWECNPDHIPGRGCAG